MPQTVAVQNGTAVNIGFPGGIPLSSPNLSSNLILQSADESAGANNYRVEDEVGDVVVSAWSDPHTKCTLEMIIKGSGIAAAQIASTLSGLTPGTLCTFGTFLPMPDITGAAWEMMDSPKIAGSNKDAKKLTCNLEKRAGITAVASA